MTICILRQEAGQNIPHPFQRACSPEEMEEILVHHARYTGQLMHGERKVFLDRIDLDDPTRPVAMIGTANFYAFHERA